jgi:SAM-dependent methyltransferase
MKKLKIIFKKLFYPLIFFTEFIIYIAKFYEYLDGLKFAKNFRNLKKKKILSKLNKKKIYPNKLINFYLNNKKNGMTKFIHYLHSYNEYFYFLKENRKKIRILEIGVFSGGSLDMYKEFFGKKKIKIVGIDIDKECLKFNDEISEIQIGDQENEEFLTKFKKKHTIFDLIIDDGGHTCEQQKKSFEFLFPLLSDGGIYIIEDVSHRFFSYINGLLNEFNEISLKKNPVETKDIQKEIMRIEIIPNCIVIRKYLKKDIPNTFNSPWIGNIWTEAAKNLFNKYNSGINRFKKNN